MCVSQHSFGTALLCCCVTASHLCTLFYSARELQWCQGDVCTYAAHPTCFSLNPPVLLCRFMVSVSGGPGSSAGLGVSRRGVYMRQPHEAAAAANYTVTITPMLHEVCSRICSATAQRTSAALLCLALSTCGALRPWPCRFTHACWLLLKHRAPDYCSPAVVECRMPP